MNGVIFVLLSSKMDVGLFGESLVAVTNNYALWFAAMQMAYAAEFVLPENRAPVLPPDAVEENYFQGPHDARAWVGTWQNKRVLMFQGTQPTEFWSLMANLDTSPVKFSDGQELVAGYWNQVLDIQPLLGSIVQKFDIIGGHSMGGGMAMQYYRRLYAARSLLITFGAVKAGNTIFYNHPKLLDSLRIVNGPDPAPAYPPGWDPNPIPMQWLYKGKSTLLLPSFPLGDVKRPILVDPLDLTYHFPGSYLGSLEELL